ncbi:hypothetical protein TRFO_18073 [Tritrichomonas foetus]|uniref:SCP domain-containing protein n=1 Tax=Tritrichomonas foetus TaxID=1144522 RepID=A0A1J4KS16_9EUKA|nr:hypothetical protein TRFO_18073 [Tritrichomonas foetus]|eukprot:OHT12261.1 hypothetical protein TRFO_18073 [Tritrichomonas foetus]
MSSVSNPNCVPEKILRKIFDSVNEVREQYNRPPLQFSKELSFLAGEHACNMSTNKVPVGHDGFHERQMHTPMAITFSENIAVIDDHINPAQNVVVKWLSKSSTFSRILASFTHTGVGVAESDDGVFYCCQIYATFKTKLSKKDQLLLVGRFVNKIRFRKGLKPLAFSLSATAKLISLSNEVPEAILGITTTRIKLMFQNCSEAEYIMEKFPHSPDTLQNFFNTIMEHSNYQRNIRKDYTDIAFAMKYINQDNVVCAMLLAKCTSAYKKIPVIDMHYPMAAKFLQLVNDYRAAHKMKCIKLSHQWCRFADKYTLKMMNREIEIDDSKVKSILNKLQPSNTKVSVGACLIPMSYDPVRELFLIWISNFNTRIKILSDVNNFGLGISVSSDGKLCYAIRIFGNAQNDDSPEPENVEYDPQTSQYACLTSDANGGNEEVPRNTSATFRLTG